MKVRNLAKKYGNKLATAGVFAVSTLPVLASAAITTTDLDPIGTEVSGDVSTVVTWVLPIMGTVLAATIGIKLVKRFTNKI